MSKKFKKNKNYRKNGWYYNQTVESLLNGLLDLVI